MKMQRFVTRKERRRERGKAYSDSTFTETEQATWPGKTDKGLKMLRMRNASGMPLEIVALEMEAKLSVRAMDGFAIFVFLLILATHVLASSSTLEEHNVRCKGRIDQIYTPKPEI
ncbi:hypothetical protein M0R45_034522 [Rubus argutus]|uniref:Transmembrane protein n=1 Tax=Rubus argutus TaxID=59490 RepID=A0AAW1VTZ0_RUBAR